MRKERGDLVGVDELVDAPENIGGVVEGIVADAGAGDDERVEEGELFARVLAVDEEKVLSSKCDESDRVFSAVVVCACKGAHSLRVENPPGKLSLQPDVDAQPP
jgi:hypothetical protein